MYGWSRGSIVVVIRVAASASVRATARRSVPVVSIRYHSWDGDLWC
jgi:hypothetical protein